MKSIKDLTDQVKKVEEGAEKRTAQAMDVENQLNTIMTEMQHLEPKQRHIRQYCPTLLTCSSCFGTRLACTCYMHASCQAATACL